MRTQFAFAVVLLAVFFFGAGLAFWSEHKGQARYIDLLQQDQVVSKKLPEFKALLQRLDVATVRYLHTGKEGWLRARGALLVKVGHLQSELAGLTAESGYRSTLEALNRQLKSRFMEEDLWIRARDQGKLNPEMVARIMSARRNYEKPLEIALNAHDIDMRELPARINAAQRGYRYGILVLLLLGLATSAFLAWALRRYIIEPICALEEYARNWKLGQPWMCATASVSPEISSLFERMRGVMSDLNAAYRREKATGELKSELVSTVSHDLINAISVIHAAALNLAEMESGQGDENRVKMYRLIERQSLSLSTEIRNLLSNARMESGQFAYNKKKVDVGALLRGNIELAGILCESKKLSVALNLPDAPIAVYADPDALALAVTNLLSNAIKYTPEGGFISIGAAPEGRQGELVRIHVKDTGVGIEPDEQTKIFSGFYRTAEGRRSALGFGIGLLLTKKIIEAHGGKVELASRPGQGSTFSLLLPAWRPRIEGGIKKTAPAGARRRVGAAG